MKLPSIFGMRGARDKPKDSYGGLAYSFFLWEKHQWEKCK